MARKEALLILNFKTVLINLIFYRNQILRSFGSVINVSKSIGKEINFKNLIHDLNKKYKNE